MIRQVLTAALVLLLVPLAASAGSFWQADGGFLEQQFDSKGKIPTQRILFVWEPHYPANSGVTYEVYVLCSRSTAAGDSVGRNKYKAKSIAIGPVDSEVTVKTMPGKMNDGFVSREVPELENFADEIAVVGEVTFVFKKKVDAGDIVLCRIDVTETV